VMTLASLVTWFIYNFFLLPGEANVFYRLGLIAVDTSLVDVLKVVTYILVIATLVQLVEMVMRKSVPALYRALGIYLPLITTNCAVMGVALLNIKSFGMLSIGKSLAHTMVQGVGAGVGFLLVLYLMSGIREVLDRTDVPKAFKGVPIAFICAALMALAFMGFAGLAQE